MNSFHSTVLKLTILFLKEKSCNTSTHGTARSIQSFALFTREFRLSGLVGVKRDTR